ncbi:MAG: hypothetical protein O7E52_11720 [Candidatus Poribacteria bacterium]|nr:hypothetical protein [Candidatus Poribacteria bacterium]
MLFVTAFEQFALSSGQPQHRVGESVYAVLVPCFFCILLGLVVPRQAIESFQSERHSANWDLLSLTPVGHRKFLFSKLIGALTATLWHIWLAIPLFWLSVYIGGLALSQLLQCGLVFIVGFTSFFCIGTIFTLLGSPVHAISRSYAVVLIFTVIPLIIPKMVPLLSLPLAVLDLLRTLSPLCALIAIVKSQVRISLGIAPIWVWTVFYHTMLSATLFWIASRQLAKGNLSAEDNG